MTEELEDAVRRALVGEGDDRFVRLEARLRQAQLHADVSELDALLDEDLLFTGPDGRLASKADDLGAHRGGVVRFLRHDPIELRIRPVGDDTAVIALLTDLEVDVAGTVVRGPVRYTRVWNRSADDAWRVVAGHVAPVTSG